jgi:hypothetical protein
MAQYALVDANNVIQNVIVWDGIAPYIPPAGQKIMPLAQALASATFPAAPVKTVYTHAEFIALFTTAELTAISAAIATTPALFIWYTTMIISPSVDVTNLQAIAGINALVAAGLLTKARAAAILGG